MAPAILAAVAASSAMHTNTIYGPNPSPMVIHVDHAPATSVNLKRAEPTNVPEYGPVCFYIRGARHCVGDGSNWASPLLPPKPTAKNPWLCRTNLDSSLNCVETMHLEDSASYLQSRDNHWMDCHYVGNEIWCTTSDPEIGPQIQANPLLQCTLDGGTFHCTPVEGQDGEHMDLYTTVSQAPTNAVDQDNRKPFIPPMIPPTAGDQDQRIPPRIPPQGSNLQRRGDSMTCYRVDDEAYCVHPDVDHKFQVPSDPLVSCKTINGKFTCDHHYHAKREAFPPNPLNGDDEKTCFRLNDKDLCASLGEPIEFKLPGDLRVSCKIVDGQVVCSSTEPDTSGDDKVDGSDLLQQVNEHNKGKYTGPFAIPDFPGPIKPVNPMDPVGPVGVLPPADADKLPSHGILPPPVIGTIPPIIDNLPNRNDKLPPPIFGPIPPIAANLPHHNGILPPPIESMLPPIANLPNRNGFLPHPHPPKFSPPSTANDPPHNRNRFVPPPAYLLPPPARILPPPMGSMIPPIANKGPHCDCQMPPFAGHKMCECKPKPEPKGWGSWWPWWGRNGEKGDRGLSG